MTKHNTPNCAENASRHENTSLEMPSKRPNHAAIELVEDELKRVVGGIRPVKYSV
jgi:hypothetical protein